ncbi:MAG: nicotinate-nucleotide adenylyltransferase [Candidatus Paralactobacillus gallistercoris]|uniref:Probable nicotinate-nucleotide adenylyltransferase n=1 Tax=Candidatus Paralactobacillus gallistercoris TaxID=2838724 RepID=A0A948WZK7_9LACO|nr:nicotinate-nucleotide adenylyltransferase [Candidatus Paralactobacillus gallistercoris]
MLVKKVIDVQPQVQLKNTNNHRQVGILGGTFNPPHLGHLIIADQVATQLHLDQVYLMPDAQPPHLARKTNTHVLAAAERIAMLKLAIAHNPRLALELTEINRGGVSYTYDTMLQLKQQHPDTDYYFIIGADMVADLPNWHAIDKLQKLVTFVGVKRIGYDLVSPYPVLWVDVPYIDISSTAIRARIKRGCSINYLVPDAVIDYIHKKGLYH